MDQRRFLYIFRSGIVDYLSEGEEFVEGPPFQRLIEAVQLCIQVRRLLAPDGHAKGQGSARGTGRAWHHVLAAQRDERARFAKGVEG
jgi:hypothetical protein